MGNAITTGKVRLSFCHVWQPQAPLNGQGDAKYSVTLLIPKNDVQTLNAIYAAMEAAKQEGVSSTWGGNLPPIVKYPIYDGDGVRSSGEPFGEECKGHMVITANSKAQPGVVDINVQPILNQSEVYSGCFARVNLNFFPYSNSGNKGIGCGLNCVQKVADGEPLSGGVSAEEAFGGKNAYVAAAAQNAQTQQYNAGMPAQSYQMPTQQPYQPPTQQAYPQAAMPPYGQIPQGSPYGNAGMPAQPYQQYPQIDPVTGQPAIGNVMGL